MRLKPENSKHGSCAKQSAMKFAGFVALIVVALWGLYLWKSSTPVYHEYLLNLKNGYSLTFRTPEDWLLDEKETIEIRAMFSKIVLPNGNHITHIIFKRIKPTGLLAWAEEILNGNDINFNLPKKTRIQCLSALATGKIDPNAECRNEIEKERKLFSDKTYLSFNPKIEIYNLSPLGSGFKQILTSQKL